MHTLLVIEPVSLLHIRQRRRWGVALIVLRDRWAGRAPARHAGISPDLVCSATVVDLFGNTLISNRHVVRLEYFTTAQNVHGDLRRALVPAVGVVRQPPQPLDILFIPAALVVAPDVPHDFIFALRLGTQPV